jgi:hypothetical protein
MATKAVVALAMVWLDVLKISRKLQQIHLFAAPRATW